MQTVSTTWSFRYVVCERAREGVCVFCVLCSLGDIFAPLCVHALRVLYINCGLPLKSSCVRLVVSACVRLEEPFVVFRVSVKRLPAR